jgi:hypothetical protein
VDEPGSHDVRTLMERADGLYICRIGFVETMRAVELGGGTDAATEAREDWPSFGIVEVDQSLVEDATALAIRRRLRSLDALHLAAALTLPRNELTVLTADQRLGDAATAEGLRISGL